MEFLLLFILLIVVAYVLSTFYGSGQNDLYALIKTVDQSKAKDVNTVTLPELQQILGYYDDIFPEVCIQNYINSPGQDIKDKKYTLLILIRAIKTVHAEILIEGLNKTIASRSRFRGQVFQNIYDIGEPPGFTELKNDIFDHYDKSLDSNVNNDKMKEGLKLIYACSGIDDWIKKNSTFSKSNTCILI